MNQQTVLANYKDLKKKKDMIEEKLARSNFTVQVDFDEEVINKLL